MNRLLRFLSRLALDTLKGIGTALAVVLVLTFVASIFTGLVWLMGYITLHLTHFTPPVGHGSPEMNLGVLILLGLIGLGFASGFAWEAFKAVRQQWRDAALPRPSDGE